eukprot:gb/GECH01006598.1/.p1 GENE.gb/GECH01006598.1/~~gb/GECH01006598.1/.p1  ORF type:complete len:1525 (+),score=259.90 gb/GECH01006598.1/:1-4575(+)
MNVETQDDIPSSVGSDLDLMNHDGGKKKNKISSSFANDRSRKFSSPTLETEPQDKEVTFRVTDSSNSLSSQFSSYSYGEDIIETFSLLCYYLSFKSQTLTEKLLGLGSVGVAIGLGLLKVTWGGSASWIPYLATYTWKISLLNSWLFFIILTASIVVVTTTVALLILHFFQIWNGTLQKMKNPKWNVFLLSFVRHVVSFSLTVQLSGLMECEFTAGQCFNILNLFIIALTIISWISAQICIILGTFTFVAEPKLNYEAQNTIIVQGLCNLILQIDFCIFTFFPSSKFVMLFFACFGYGCCLVLIIMLIPYYKMAANFFVCFVNGFLFGLNIRAISYHFVYENSTTNVLEIYGFLGYISVGMGAGILAILLLLFRMWKCVRKTNSKSAREAEIRTRILDSSWLSLVFRRYNEQSTDQVVRMSESNHGYSFENYRLYASRFPSSALLQISWGTFIKENLADRSLALSHIMESRKNCPKLDLALLSYCRMRQYSTNEEIDDLEMRTTLSKARFLTEEISKYQKFFWTLLLREQLDARTISKITSWIEDTEAAAERMFTRLRQRFSNNMKILKSYASFLELSRGSSYYKKTFPSEVEEWDEESTRPLTRKPTNQISKKKLDVTENSSEIEQSTDWLSNPGHDTHVRSQGTLALWVFSCFVTLAAIAAIFVSFYLPQQDEEHLKYHSRYLHPYYQTQINSQKVPLSLFKHWLETRYQTESRIPTSYQDITSHLDNYTKSSQSLAQYSRNSEKIENLFLKTNFVPFIYFSPVTFQFGNDMHTILESTELMILGTNVLISDPIWNDFNPQRLQLDFRWRFVLDNMPYQVGDKLNLVGKYFENKYLDGLQFHLLSYSLIVSAVMLSIFIVLCLIAVTIILKQHYGERRVADLLKNVPNYVAMQIIENCKYKEHLDVEDLYSKARKTLCIHSKTGISLFLILVIIFGSLSSMIAIQNSFYQSVKNHAHANDLGSGIEFYSHRAFIRTLQILFDDSPVQDQEHISGIREDLDRFKTKMSNFFFGDESFMGVQGMLETQNSMKSDMIDLCGQDDPKCSSINREGVIYLEDISALIMMNGSRTETIINSDEYLSVLRLHQNLKDLVSIVVHHYHEGLRHEITKTTTISAIILLILLPIILLLSLCFLGPYLSKTKKCKQRLRLLVSMIPNSELRKLPNIKSFLKHGKSKSKEKYRKSTKSILQAAGDGVVVLDNDGIIIEINSVAEKMFKKSADNVLSFPLSTLLIESDSENQNSIESILNMRKGSSMSLDINVMSGDNSSFPARISVSCADLENSRQFAMFIRDLTEEKQRQKELMNQKEESEKLLLNVLPRHIAGRLQHGETEIYETYPNCTVLFGDMVAFTSLSSNISASELVSILNQIFSRFDQICNRYHIEKVKTIGDAFLAVAGLEEREDHAESVLDATLDMIQTLKEIREERFIDVSFRFGVHSGTVIGGVFGETKFQFDILGETVDIAEEMEGKSAANSVTVSTKTHELVKEKYNFEEKTASNGEISYICLHRKSFSRFPKNSFSEFD